MDIKGSQTEKNILTAFAGESQARNRYDFFAGKARKEGFVQIAQVFEETAGHEKAHASRLFKLLQGGEVEITGSFPAGGNGTTEENLRAAAEGETYEELEMYPAFAKTAREEGFEGIAQTFEAIAVAERQHGKRFREMADNIAAGRVFVRGETVRWRCRNCGFVHEGEVAPKSCAACAHPQAHFELLAENW